MNMYELRKTSLPTTEQIGNLADRNGNNDGYNPKDPKHKLAKLALIMDEIAEEVHNVSKGCDDCSELVDVIIRIYSYVAWLGIPTDHLEAMVVKKHTFNMTRPPKHGKLTN